MQNPNCKQMLIQNVPLKIIYKILVYNIIPIESTVTTLIQSPKYYSTIYHSVTFIGYIFIICNINSAIIWIAD